MNGMPTTELLATIDADRRRELEALARVRLVTADRRVHHRSITERLSRWLRRQ